ncbi:MAG TPA: ATP-binding protein [Cytophagaceae bacterium]|nr:ATP-binding protein [Cytophagaceae bacterium]
MDLFSDNINIDNLEVATRLFRESRAGFFQLFNNSPVCMSMTTTNLGKRTYVRVNKKFLEKFMYAESEIIGHTSVEVGILDQEESIRVGSIIKEKGRLQNDYVKCIAKDGSIVHTVSSIEKMQMNGEEVLVSFFLDITKIIEQQLIIEQHMQQLEAVNKELEAFSYSVSHDLMAPLRAINGYVKILEEDFSSTFDDEGKRVLTAVQKNAKKMGNLINDLLSFARVGKKAIQKTTIDINDLVNEILMDFKNSGHKAEIIVGDLQPVCGDPGLIKQVFVNLISNAIKYSSKKENPVIEISSALNNNHIVYTIKDNGDGFDMKYADRLFGVFQRLHSDNQFEGTGVGLATVQRIINKHGGVIHAEAEPGKGATFWFTLPIEK